MAVVFSLKPYLIRKHLNNINNELIIGSQIILTVDNFFNKKYLFASFQGSFLDGALLENNHHYSNE